MQVLSLGTPGVEAFGADGTTVAAEANDELSEVIKKYPGRFAGFAAIAPQDPEQAAKELERAVKKLGLKGAMITGHINGEYLDNKKYWVIFEAAEKLGVPIYIHPRQPPADMIKQYLVQPVLALAMWGYAAETSLHALRILCAGVFDKYPKLQIILGHLGEGIPYFLWRLDSRYPKGEMQKSFVPFVKLKRNPSEYFIENFYISISGMYWEPALRLAHTALGADKIMFATDYPAEAIPPAIKSIQSMQISDIDKEKIFHLNAERLLNL